MPKTATKPETELPAAAELEAPQEPKSIRTFSIKIRRPSAVPDSMVDGYVAVSECAGTIEANEFIPKDANDLTEDQRYSMWWMILDLADLDKIVFARAARIFAIDKRIAELKAEQESIADGIHRLVNNHADVVPAPAEGKSFKPSVGPYSGFNYRNQPERSPEWKLEDKTAAAADGKLRERVVMEAWPNGLLNDYYAKEKKEPPGYTRTPQLAISVTIKKETEDAA